jgi:hypothetical protein
MWRHVRHARNTPESQRNRPQPPKPQPLSKAARARALKVPELAARNGDVSATRALLELGAAAERDARVAEALAALRASLAEGGK